ncbi:MAG: hypothetical protein A3H27_12315 [Acidobacteria bacterium RIFCSPLOWO2_02_FULL_59_13]|nr:MAG: hypothetical protein A3H27_12315 [Acidobacteria bacterium RIFCSPLOWO2_02_FULL_59_13]
MKSLPPVTLEMDSQLTESIYLEIPLERPQRLTEAFGVAFLLSGKTPRRTPQLPANPRRIPDGSKRNG